MGCTRALAQSVDMRMKCTSTCIFRYQLEGSLSLLSSVFSLSFSLFPCFLALFFLLSCLFCSIFLLHALFFPSAAKTYKPLNSCVLSCVCKQFFLFVHVVSPLRDYYFLDNALDRAEDRACLKLETRLNAYKKGATIGLRPDIKWIHKRQQDCIRFSSAQGNRKWHCPLVFSRRRLMT